ncbi:MAG: TrmB family transcriptional regulator [Nanoarchaeota archaeon]
MDSKYSMLQEIGLNPQEINVYINTLKSGLAKASEIARKSGVKREAVYYTLGSLIEKGMINEVLKSSVRYYSAISPDRIQGLLNEQNENKKRIIKELLPELQSIKNSFLTTPKVEIYEGDMGFKNIASMMLDKRNSEIYCYVPFCIFDKFPFFQEKFRMLRRSKKIKLRGITEDCDEMRQIAKSDKKELRITKYNNLIRNKQIALYILDDRLIILEVNNNEKIGICIHDKTICALQKEIFKIIWENSME